DVNCREGTYRGQCERGDGSAAFASFIRLPKKSEKRDQAASGRVDNCLNQPNGLIIAVAKYRIDASDEQRITRQANQRRRIWRFRLMRIDVLFKHVPRNLRVNLTVIRRVI